MSTRKGVSYSEMYFWASGEVEHLKLMEQRFSPSEARTNAIERAEATLRLVAWCWDHSTDIKDIAARDARDKARKAQMSPSGPSSNYGNAHEMGTSSAAE